MNEIKTWLRLLVAYQSRPSRWWYLPFLLVEGGLGLLALGEGYPGSWFYLTVALVFLAQTKRPTVLGWWATLVAWFASEFIQPLYDRLVFHIPGYTITFFLLWGLAPLVLLWFIRPRPPRAASTADVEVIATMGLPKRRRGRLSPFLCALAGAIATGGPVASNSIAHRSSNPIQIIAFAICSVLIVISLFIEPNTN